jgi:deoxyribodipyrimidine photo-lyase
MKQQVAIMWFRRDLRLEDNAALHKALTIGIPVLPIFIFDRNILDKLTSKSDARVHFIHNEVARIKSELEKSGASLRTFYDTPLNAFKQLLKDYDVKKVFSNRDYETYAQQRDREIFDLLAAEKIEFKGAKDHVIFEKDEVTKDDGNPYTVFTPYSKKWKAKLNPFYLKPYPSEKYLKHLFLCSPFKMHTLEEMGFKKTTCQFPARVANLDTIKNYEKYRDIPSLAGTTRLSLHLRFGTVSIRKLTQIALKTSEKWLNELIWRDFYQAILWFYPHTEHSSFKPVYDRIEWTNNEEHFKKWCEGKTGYPIVDAGMRELNETGFMHNRVRMVVASFLTKHLLIDWRWGEKYFAEKLLDYECASNIGGWQWAAGCGCDAAPYFRIFNPESQTQKFDPEYKYIKKWVPEFGTLKYPTPVVDHKMARERCLEVYKKAVKI